MSPVIDHISSDDGTFSNNSGAIIVEFSPIQMLKTKFSKIRFTQSPYRCSMKSKRR